MLNFSAWGENDWLKRGTRGYAALTARIILKYLNEPHGSCQRLAETYLHICGGSRASMTRAEARVQ